MPRFLIPKKHGPHRVAAIALYRALLRQCSASPFNDKQRSSLQNIVRNNFKRNADIHSTRLLKLAFHAGYEVYRYFLSGPKRVDKPQHQLKQLEVLLRMLQIPEGHSVVQALDHLDASVAESSSSISRIQDILEKAPAYLTRPPKRSRPLSPPKPDPRLLCLPPGTGPVSARPLPAEKVNGIRRVPVLASANGIPFLRLTKPQPPSLSRVLNDKLDQQQRRFNRRDEMIESFMPLAAREDEWDAILWEQCRVRSGGGLDWRKYLELEERGILRTIDSQRERWKETAEKMQGIVDQETGLARQEKMVRDEDKRQRRLERRAARREGRKGVE